LSGVVVNDYETVMPVPWRKKYGIRYCYDVPFIQQLGIFPAGNSVHTQSCLAALTGLCRFGNYNFNFANNIPATTSRTNFTLPLQAGMARAFSANTVQNIRRSNEFGLRYTAASFDEAIDLYVSTYGQQFRHIREISFQRFRTLCRSLDQQQQIVVRKTVNGSNDTLAIVLLLKDRRRLYNIMNTTLREGRDKEANYHLFGNIFSEFEGSGLLFDFEGSDVSGIAHFYKKFGAMNEPYARWHINRLPWPLSLFRKEQPL
jgi:hypothetical protein